MEARNRNLGQWLPRLRSGQVQLPRFQRFEAWGPREVADLLQTVLDQLPAGAVLVLEIGDKPPFRHRPLAGAPEPTERLGELLLDGQQRLTAIWRGLNDDYPDQTYFVDVRDIDADEDGRRDYRVLPQTRWWHKDRRFPMWCDDPKQVLGRNLIPFRLLRPDDDASWDAWLRLAVADDGHGNYAELMRLVLDLRVRVSQFNLPFLALPIGASEATVLNVFVKLNTSSVRLTAFDIIVARVEEETGESLHDLVASLEGQIPALKRYVDAQDLVLPAAALLQGHRPTQRELVFLDFERMIAEWPKIVDGAQRLVSFLDEESILDGVRLPSEVVLAPLVALWAHASDAPDHLGRTRSLLRSYMWRAFATARYEFAAATASYQDFEKLLTAVIAGNSSAGAPIFDVPLPTPDELLVAGWPKRRDRLARTVLCISFRQGANDIADGARVSSENVGGREYHHLFPIAFLRGRGVEEYRASRALNCALITWRTNRAIAAKPPVDYLRERADAAALAKTRYGTVWHRMRSTTTTWHGGTTPNS